MPGKFNYSCYFYLHTFNLKEGECTALLLFLKNLILKQFFLLIALCDHIEKLEYKV